MRNKPTIYLTGHFCCYLVSYNTTGVHSSDKMTDSGLPLACLFEMHALQLPINTPPFLKKGMYGVTREAIRKAIRKQKTT